MHGDQEVIGSQGGIHHAQEPPPRADGGRLHAGRRGDCPLRHPRRNRRADISTGNTTDTLKFPNGSIRLRHSAGTGPQSFDPRTCLNTVNQHGTYRLLGGTGKYAGISGHGRFQLNVLAVGARSHGKCSQTKPLVAFELIIRAAGPVHL
jgi:hypothetical protein